MFNRVLKFTFRWHWSCCCWHWAMKWEWMVKEVIGNVGSIHHLSQDHIVSPFWSLVQLVMVKHWTPLHFRMPSSISSHLLIKVVLSYMYPLEHGLLKVSISLAILPSFWKKAQSLSDLRYFLFTFCIFFSLPFDYCLLCI